MLFFTRSNTTIILIVILMQKYSIKPKQFNSIPRKYIIDIISLHINDRFDYLEKHMNNSDKTILIPGNFGSLRKSDVLGHQLGYGRAIFQFMGKGFAEFQSKPVRDTLDERVYRLYTNYKGRVTIGHIDSNSSNYDFVLWGANIFNWFDCGLGGGQAMAVKKYARDNNYGIITTPIGITLLED